MAEAEATYLLGALERRGSIAGWRPGQVAIVGISCVVAVGVLSTSTAPPAIAMALVAAAVGICGATVPVRGRTADEWVPSLLAHVRRRGSRKLLEVEITESGGYGIAHLSDGSISCTMELESTGISLLDPRARAQRVDGFSAALGALAREGGPIDRVAWTMTCSPASTDGYLADLRRRGELGTPASAAYRLLLAEASVRGLERSVLLTLRSSGRRRSADREAVLLEEADLVARAIEGAGHRPCRRLSAEDLALRLVEAGGTAEEGQAQFSARSRLGEVRLERHRAVAWWIAEWPSQPATAELLAPLLLGDRHRRVSVVIEPVQPAAALRRAASSKTSEVADAEIRRRAGFLQDRRQQRRSVHVDEREAELVDGFGSVRISGFVAVIVDDDDLEGPIASAELAAAQARLSLRRLEGDHGRGLCATLPLGLGLP